MSTTTNAAPRPGPRDSTGTGSARGGTRPAGRVDRATWGLAIANLVAQIGIIVTGGAVRLTGSGLGCSTWPMCEPGSFTPVFHEETSIHQLIEFGNRTLTGVLGVIAVALVWAVYRRRPTAARPASLRRLAWLPLLGVALQAVIGGITVLVDLHPAIVGSHMLISLALVAVSAYLLVRLRQPDGPAVPLATGPLRLAPGLLAVLAALVVALGTVVTGSGPHSGDDEAAYRYALDPLLVTRLHSGSVWLFVLFAVAVAVLLSRRRGDAGLGRARRTWRWLLVVVVLEGVIGYTQHFLGLPEALVAAHMLGAALVVVAATFACCAFYARPAAATPRD